MPLILLLAFALLFSACNKHSVNEPCTQSAPCTTPTLLPYFPSYTYAEADTLICITYVAGSNFNTVVSMQSYITHATFKINVADTFTNVAAGIIIAPGYDYGLIVPATGDTFRISNIRIPGRSETFECTNDKYHICYNTISEFSVTKNAQADVLINFVQIPSDTW